MADTVLMERRGEVALLTLNRPDKLNALNYETNDLLVRLLDRIEDNEDVQNVWANFEIPDEVMAKLEEE